MAARVNAPQSEYLVGTTPPIYRSFRGRGGVLGTVKWFNDSKGYGFISPDEGEKDLFVHHTSIAGDGYKSLPEGAKVEYEAAEGAKGPEAKNVTTVG
jgi:CspA family cold shock protein